MKLWSQSIVPFSWALKNQISTADWQMLIFTLSVLFGSLQDSFAAQQIRLYTDTFSKFISRWAGVERASSLGYFSYTLETSSRPPSFNQTNLSRTFTRDNILAISVGFSVPRCLFWIVTYMITVKEQTCSIAIMPCDSVDHMVHYATCGHVMVNSGSCDLRTAKAIPRDPALTCLDIAQSAKIGTVWRLTFSATLTLPSLKGSDLTQEQVQDF